MQIINITPQYKKYGGVESVINNIIKFWVGFDKFKIITKKCDFKDSNVDTLSYINIKYLKSFSTYPYLFFKILNSRYDYLFIHDFSMFLPCWLANLFRRKKIIFFIHGFEKNPFTTIIIKLYIKISDKVILPSYSLKEYYCSKNSNNVLVIFWGVDKITCKPKLRNKILFVGNLINHKGIDKFCEIAKELKQNGFENEFVAIGTGNQFDYLSKKYSKYVNFIGYVDHKEINNYYSESYLFILPSESEGFGLVWVEALFNDCIIVGTKTGIFPYLLDKYVDRCKLIDDYESIKNTIINTEYHSFKSKIDYLEFDWKNNVKRIQEAIIDV